MKYAHFGVQLHCLWGGIFHLIVYTSHLCDGGSVCFIVCFLGEKFHRNDLHKYLRFKLEKKTTMFPNMFPNINSQSKIGIIFCWVSKVRRADQN